MHFKTSVKQYFQRVEHLPEGTKQEVLIDFRGQVVPRKFLDEIYDKIVEKTNGNMAVEFRGDRE